MRGHPTYSIIFGFLVALSWAGAATAQLTVSPLRVIVTPNDPVAVLNVTNQAEQNSLLQVDVVAWRQTADGDRFEQTDGVVAIPPVLQLTPGQRQQIRIAARGENTGAAVESYRLYLREVAPSRENRDQQGIRALIRIGVPLFVYPTLGVTPDIRCTVERTARLISLSNAGSAPAKIDHIAIVDKNGEQTGQLPGTGHLIPAGLASISVDREVDLEGAAGCQANTERTIVQSKS